MSLATSLPASALRSNTRTVASRAVNSVNRSPVLADGWETPLLVVVAVAAWSGR
jgi:hypothetical protein